MKKHLTNTLIVTVFFTFSCIITSCTQRIMDFTVISTKNVEIGAKYKKLNRVEGEDKTIYVLFVPIGTPNLEEAVDDCLKNGKGIILTDGVIKHTNWWALLYGEMAYTVIGDVWAKADMGDLNNPDIELFELRAGSSGSYELVSTKDSENVLKVTHYIEN